MFRIKTPSIEDAALILTLIKELAAYEKLEDRVVATIEDVKNTLFGKNPTVHTLIAEKDGEAVGFIIYHTSYSTFLCKICLHIEDLYIRESQRGNGYGEALIKAICKIAYENDYGRLDWVVLDWNRPAIDFYKHIGAEELSEWKMFRLNYEDIQRLAHKSVL
jgi:GNAT superfamily N-acetyltransferase